MYLRQAVVTTLLAVLAPLSAHAALYTEAETAHDDTNAIDGWNGVTGTATGQAEDLGVLSASDPVTINGYMGWAQGQDGSVFASTDSYSFDVLAGTTVTATLSIYRDSTATDPIADIADARPTVSLYNTSAGLTGSVAYDSTAPLTVTYTFADAGTYRVGVGSGGDQVSGKTGWSYNLQVTSVTPVPEPESLAMMLAGMGVLATLARRRKARNA